MTAAQQRGARRLSRGRSVGRRIGHLLAVLFLVTFGTAMMLELVPGDPAYAILGDQATPEQVAALHKELNLDQPMPVRYAKWLGNVLTGDFGHSVKDGRSVTDAVRAALPISLEIAVLTMVFAAIIALPVALLAAYRAGKMFDRTTTIVSSAFISAPSFFAGLLLVYAFAVHWRIFPVTGWIYLTDDLLENLRHAFLPALTLALAEIAVAVRLLRTDLVATLQENYILAARARGMRPSHIMLREALRPSSFSLVTLAGLNFGRLLGGAIIVEYLFALPGVGQLLIQAVLVKDLPMVQGVVLFVAIIYVVINLLVDLVYPLLDPRLRRGTT